MSGPSAAAWDDRDGFVHDHRATALLAVAVQPASDRLRHRHHLDPVQGECLQEWLDEHDRQVAHVLWRADGSGRVLLRDAAGSTVRTLDRLPGRDWPVGSVHALRAHLASAAAALAAADGAGESGGEPTGSSTAPSTAASVDPSTDPSATRGER